MKQTAVEWYAIEMANYLKDFYGDGIINIDILKKAKEIEKQQIIKAYQQGVTDEHGDTIIFTTEGEEYYKTTYKI